MRNEENKSDIFLADMTMCIMLKFCLFERDEFVPAAGQVNSSKPRTKEPTSAMCYVLDNKYKTIR